MNLREIATDTIAWPLESVTSDRPLIQEIQTRLQVWGFPPGAVNGVWGNGTATALGNFARANRMSAAELTPQMARLLLSNPSAKPASTGTQTPARPASGVPSSGSAPGTGQAPGSSTPPSSGRPPGMGDSGIATEATLTEALQFTLRWEGGYSNHPNDPGGATMKGIIQRVYDAYRRDKGLALQPVKGIQDAEVREIYETRYWRAARCPQMQRVLAIVMFDTAVNFGVRGAIEFLQEALGLVADGNWGPKTNAAFLANNTKATAIKICEGRIAYRSLRVKQDPTQKVFLQGWLNRDNDLLALCRRLS